MKLPETWYRLSEARASDRMEPIRKEYDKRKSSAGSNYHQRLTVDANATVDFTLKLFEIETETLIETYKEWGKGYPDDQDYDDFMKRLDSVAQTHIGHFNQSHTNVFSQQNEFILKAQREFVEREVKSNVGRAIKSLHTFLLEGKAKAEDDFYKNLPESSVSATEENSQFSDTEKSVIFSRLEEIKQSLVTSLEEQELPAMERQAKLEHIASEIKYLKDGAERLGKKDWKNAVIGVIFGLISTLALSPEARLTIGKMLKGLVEYIIRHPHPLLP